MNSGDTCISSLSLRSRRSWVFRYAGQSVTYRKRNSEGWNYSKIKQCMVWKYRRLPVHLLIPLFLMDREVLGVLGFQDLHAFLQLQQQLVLGFQVVQVTPLALGILEGPFLQ